MLFEDVPGTAKTILARAIAGSIEGAIPSRIQCTPDLQPTDVTGLSVFNQETRRFEFQPGPLFANILLVDEINRAMPKTQSALLEAMAEHQVTVDGVTRRLPDLFLLIATENPIEYEGTFPLPEAQLDRFFIRASLGYPGEDDELLIVREQRRRHPLDALAPGRHDGRDRRRSAAASEDVYVDELLDALDGRAHARDPHARRGRGRRLGARLARARSRRRAPGRSCTGAPTSTPEDVELLFIPVLGHRLMLSPTYLAETRNLTRDEALAPDPGAAASSAPRRRAPTGRATTASTRGPRGASAAR